MLILKLKNDLKGKKHFEMEIQKRVELKNFCSFINQRKEIIYEKKIGILVFQTKSMEEYDIFKSEENAKKYEKIDAPKNR